MTKLTGASYVKITLILVLGLLILGSIAFGGVRGCSNNYLLWGNEMETGSASVKAADVRSLAIEWGSGSVKVVPVDEGDTIEVVETSPTGLNRGQQMRWSLSGGMLRIEYGSWFSCFGMGRKDLEVRIPQSCADQMETVDINGASGSYDVQGLTCERLDLDLASGQMDVRDMAAKTLQIDVASGDMSVAGRFSERVGVKTASGQARVTCDDVCPSTINADVASGFTSIAIPENEGFTARVDKASGTFSSAFQTMQQGSGYVYGDGSATVSVRLASGEVRLDKTA